MRIIKIEDYRECAECLSKADYMIVGFMFSANLCEKHMRTLKSKISYALGDFKNEQDACKESKES